MSLDRDLEHPDITAAQRTGYAAGKEPTYPVCPECGAECEKVYFDQLGICVGCDVCLDEKDAWETPECFPGKEQE